MTERARFCRRAAWPGHGRWTPAVGLALMYGLAAPGAGPARLLCGARTRSSDNAGSGAAAVWSPGGPCRLARASTGRQPTPGFRRLRDLKTGDKRVLSLAFSADGTLLAADGGGAAVRVWSVGTWRTRRVLSHAHPVALAFTPTGNRLVAGDLGGAVVCWAMATGTRVWAHQAEPVPTALLAPGHPALGLEEPSPVFALNFSPGGRWLVTGGWDGSSGTIRVWSVRPWRPAHLVAANLGGVRSAAVSPGGSLLAAAGGDGQLTIWTMPALRPVRRFREDTRSVDSVAFSPDGRQLADGFLDGRVRVRSTRSWRVLTTVASGGGDVVRAAYLPRSGLLLAATFDGRLVSWASRPPFKRGPSARVSRRIWCIAVAPSGRVVAVGTDSGAQVWSLPLGQPPGGHGAVDKNPDGSARPPVQHVEALGRLTSRARSRTATRR